MLKIFVTYSIQEALRVLIVVKTCCSLTPLFAHIIHACAHTCIQERFIVIEFIKII